MEKIKHFTARWINFNLNHPKLILGLLLVMTVILGSGLRKLGFDPSVEYLMPRSEPVYLIGERIKSAFSNNKTLVIASVEPSQGHELFSKEVFEHINKLVVEIEEYKVFDIELETRRLEKIIQLGNATFTEPEKVKDSKNGQEKEESMDAQLEEDLDKMILEGEDSSDVSKVLESKNTDSEDIWDLSKPLSDEHFATAIRGKRKYDMANYTPVSLAAIRENLDATARGQIDTILHRKSITIEDESKPLDKKEFAAILNGWEDLYLYKSMQIVQTFMNPITGEDIIGTKDELKPVDFIETSAEGKRILPKTKKDFDAYIEKISKNPMNKTLLYSEDKNGKIQALSVSMVLRTLDNYSDMGEYFWSLLDRYNKDVVVMHPYGSIVIERFMSRFMSGDLKKFLPLVFLVIVITFFLNFRSARGVILPMLTVLFGVIWTMGTMGHLGVKMSLLVSILPPLLIAIASSYSIHMFNQYMIDLPKINSGEKIQGIKDSMGHIALTVLLAALTTFISFMTLVTSQVTSLRDFGTFAAVGTIYAMTISFVMIPAVLVLAPTLSSRKHDEEIEKNSALEKFLMVISRFTTEKSRLSVVISLIFLIAGVVGLVQIKPETSPVFNFKEGSYIRSADERVGKLFHGTFSLNLVFDSGKKGGVYDPEFLNFVESIRNWLDQDFQKKDYNILMTTTFSDFLKRMHMAMNGDKSGFYKLPQTEETIRDYMEILSGDDTNSDGRLDTFEQFIDKDYRRVNLVIRTGTYEENIYNTAISKKIRKNIFDHMATIENPQKYTFVFAGDAMNFAVLADYIIKGQIQSVILSLIVIALLVFMIFRSPVAAVVSILPLVISIAIIYGMMGYAGIPLDIPKAILSSIAIGIGIDDTIHFMKTLAHNMQAGFPLKEAVRRTHEEAGLAIIYTSMALIFGFAMLMLSNFNPVFYLGMLISGVMLATTIGALVVLPSVIVALNLKIKNVDLEVEE